MAVPALAVLALLIGIASPPAASAKSCDSQNAAPGSLSTSKAEKSVFCLLNKQRSKRGIDKLSRHKALDKPSADHSKLMVADKCFEHVCPGEKALGDRLAAYLSDGGRSYGENIAYGTGSFGTPRSIVNSWMNSEGHRRNILDPGFEHIGIGIVWGNPVSGGGSSEGGTYTTDFGSRDS